jgi:putative ABC transport system substrate-binding protein
MRRREFITLIGGAVITCPMAADAQQPAMPVVGFLGASTASFSGEGQRLAAFVQRQRLRELDWIEGRNMVIEYRWAEGRADRFAEIASEFVRLKVDVIFTYATPAVIAVELTQSALDSLGLKPGMIIV